MWVLLSGFLNHLEKRRLFFFTINDEGSSENLMTAMFRVNLSETEYFRIGQLPPQVLLHLKQIIHLLPAKCQTFLLIVLFQIVYENDRLRLNVNGKDILV